MLNIIFPLVKNNQIDSIPPTMAPLSKQKSRIKNQLKKNKKQTNPRLNCSLKKQAGEHHTETRMEVGKHAGIYL